MLSEDERSREMIRLNEESRQNVFRLHRGEISEEEFVARGKELQVEMKRVVESPTDSGNGKET